MSKHKFIENLLGSLNEIGCRVWSEDGDLLVKVSKAGITEELKAQLRTNKKDVLEYLNAALNAPAPRLAEAIPTLPPGSTPVISHAQQRLWFLAQLEGASASYNMPAALKLNGMLNVEILRQTFRVLIERHQTLRLCFPNIEDESVNSEGGIQEIPLYDPLIVTDLSHLPEAQQQLEIQQHQQTQTTRPFDLAEGKLLRLNLLTLNSSEHVLLFNMHHIISDGWSMGVLIREWVEIYSALLEERRPDLLPLPIQYSDFAAWQRAWLQGEVLQRQVDYWTEQLADAPELLALPTDFSRPAMQSDSGDYLQTHIDPALSAHLNTFSKQQNSTLFMTLLAAFGTLLYRYSGQDDICIGSPIANRPHAQLENLIGFFVNTLVLRTRLNPEQGFKDLLQQVRQTCLDAYAHQDIPFETLVEQLNPTRSLGHSPLFQVMLVLQNNAQVEMELPGMNISTLEQDYPIAKFDLTLHITEQEGQLHSLWQYATSLFSEQTIRRFASHFEVLLRAISAEPETPIARLSMLTETERQQILVASSTPGKEYKNAVVPGSRDDYFQKLDFQKPYFQNQCVHERFEEQAAQTPDAVAIIFEDKEVSYDELNVRANRLAHRLRKLGGGPEVLVGLLVERSVEMVVGLLAILKAGGAYVPLDPEYPPDRLAFMAEDADLKVLLCHRPTRNTLPQCEAHIFDMDEESAAIAGERSDNPERLADENNLAYVIYTSGSTGKPKGVMVEHGMIAGHVLNNVSIYGLESRDRALQFASISFDASVQQILAPLAVGAALVLRGKEIWTPQECLDNFARYKVSVAHMTPAYVHQFLSAAAGHWAQLSACGFRLLNSGGEALPSATVALWWETTGGVGKLLNSYGPTETTVTTTIFGVAADKEPSANKKPSVNKDKKPPEDAVTTPIGKPLPGRSTYILDNHGQLLPIGIPGELYIGGAGVARGYLNRPELTTERFIPDPFSDDPASRLYKTGDLCRWLPDGNIEFLGRIDTQVKIRGFRIECGEVENTLMSHPKVPEAAVDARGEGEQKQLVAWVCAKRGNNADLAESDRSPLRDELRAHLRALLPDWMIPDRFVFVEMLPLTPNGKIDRRALVVPNSDTWETGKEYTAPRNLTEEMLCAVFADILGMARVSIHGNFFDLGGNSLLAIRLLSSIRKAFKVDIPLRAVFQYPTPKELATAIRAKEEWKPAILLPLKSGGQSSAQGAPLFCIHPVGGGAFCYRELVNSLNTERMVYGIQAVGFEGETAPLTDIATMAARYVAEITSLFPEGPYHLYGWSLGGVIAFEMARQLRNADREVGLLVLADTFCPDPNAIREEPEDNAILLHLLAEVGEVEPAFFREIQNAAPEDRLTRIRKRLTSGSNAVDSGEVDRLMRIFRANLRAVSAYRPSPLEKNIVFLSADERIEGKVDPVESGWRGVAKHIERHSVSGNHFTMHRQPGIQDIAKLLDPLFP